MKPFASWISFFRIKSELPKDLVSLERVVAEQQACFPKEEACFLEKEAALFAYEEAGISPAESSSRWLIYCCKDVAWENAKKESVNNLFFLITFLNCFMAKHESAFYCALKKVCKRNGLNLSREKNALKDLRFLDENIINLINAIIAELN